ncbi:MAG: hypothetical protein F4Y08_06785 [Caldilineaceae bacterium SB0662_bin_9]|uniref:Uncharacterized protein n=1 Tax=Caldilineaceae bacterium SB0662_bin_9 TaxID=2605258 RepID=A0A6B1DQX6_9CHLR|nr:hypothetical protein [Caldilineaceae bacterium SB0662_bin_9]
MLRAGIAERGHLHTHAVLLFVVRETMGHKTGLAVLQTCLLVDATPRLWVWVTTEAQRGRPAFPAPRAGPGS